MGRRAKRRVKICEIKRSRHGIREHIAGTVTRVRIDSDVEYAILNPVTPAGTGIVPDQDAICRGAAVENAVLQQGRPVPDEHDGEVVGVSEKVAALER
jgi:hypothetical protein